jgi:hypothetical protein
MEVCRESGTRRNLGVAATGLRDVLPSAVGVCVCQRRSGLGTEAEWDGKYRQKTGIKQQQSMQQISQHSSQHLISHMQVGRFVGCTCDDIDRPCTFRCPSSRFRRARGWISLAAAVTERASSAALCREEPHTMPVCHVSRRCRLSLIIVAVNIVSTEPVNTPRCSRPALRQRSWEVCQAPHYAPAHRL